MAGECFHRMLLDNEHRMNIGAKKFLIECINTISEFLCRSLTASSEIVEFLANRSSSY